MSLDDDTRRSLSRLVRDRGYEYREEPFTLSSGGTSHDYVDCRHVLASPEAMRVIGEAVVAAVDVPWEVVGGPTMGADPVAHATSMASGKEWFSVRKQPKGHGLAAWVEGHRMQPGDRVLVVEDTVSTGRSLLHAVERVRETGAEVVAATTVLDRSPAVADRFAAAGVPWFPLLTWEDLELEPILT